MDGVSLQVSVQIEVSETTDTTVLVRVLRAETVIAPHGSSATAEADLLAAALDRLVAEANASARDQMGHVRALAIGGESA